MNGLYGSRIRISDSQIQEQLKRLQADAQKEQYLIVGDLPVCADTGRQNASADGREFYSASNCARALRLKSQRNDFRQRRRPQRGGDMGWVVLDDFEDDRKAAVPEPERTWPNGAHYS